MTEDTQPIDLTTPNSVNYCRFVYWWGAYGVGTQEMARFDATPNHFHVQSYYDVDGSFQKAQCARHGQIAERVKSQLWFFMMKLYASNASRTSLNTAWSISA